MKIQCLPRDSNNISQTRIQSYPLKTTVSFSFFLAWPVIIICITLQSSDPGFRKSKNLTQPSNIRVFRPILPLPIANINCNITSEVINTRVLRYNMYQQTRDCCRSIHGERHCQPRQSISSIRAKQTMPSSISLRYHATMANRHKYHELFLPMILSSCFIIGIAAFPISTTLSQQSQSHRPFTHLGFRMPPCTSSLSRHRQGPDFYTSVTALPSASAWLFTPDRTNTILANTVTSHTSAALDAATTYAADAASIAVPTITHTIYKAPFLSLAISFFLGGLFFGTVAAFVAAIYAFGKENMRRVREVGAILWRRNWSVIKLTLLVTKVRIRRHSLSTFLPGNSGFRRTEGCNILFIQHRTFCWEKKNYLDSKIDFRQLSERSKTVGSKCDVFLLRVLTQLKRKHKCILLPWVCLV